MSNRKPIDKQYLLDSLKNFDQEILSKKYSNNSSGAKGEKGDKGDPGEPGKDGLSAYEIAVNNGFDGTQQEWLESLKGKNGEPGDNGASGKDGITYTPEIGTVTTVPSTENASASIDIDEENHTAKFNFDIPRGENGADGNAGTSTELPDIYITTDIPAITSTAMALTDKMLLGTPDGNKKIDQNALIEFLKGQDLIDLDGKGRPLLPGYGIVMKEVTVTINNTTYCDLGLTIEDLGIESESDIVEFLFYLDTIKDDYNNTYIFVPYILPSNKHLAITTQYANNVTLNNVKGRIGAIYKQKVPYEPGMKSITKEFTVSGDPLNHTVICNISDFEIANVNNVVSVEVTCNTMFSAYYLLDKSTGNISCNYYRSDPFSNFTFSVTLIVKDYSFIGPAIVTDGIRMITKEFTLETSGRSPQVATFSELGINHSDFIGILANLKNSNISITAYVEDGYIHVIPTYDGQTLDSGLEGIINVFVKVLVVEPRKPFTKDVEGTFSNAAWTTLLTLDGSDEVGGYTVDNVKRVSVLFLSNGNINLGILTPIIQSDGRVQVLLSGNGSYPGKVRVTIE